MERKHTSLISQLDPECAVRHSKWSHYHIGRFEASKNKLTLRESDRSVEKNLAC